MLSRAVLTGRAQDWSEISFAISCVTAQTRLVLESLTGLRPLRPDLYICVDRQTVCGFVSWVSLGWSWISTLKWLQRKQKSKSTLRKKSSLVALALYYTVQFVNITDYISGVNNKDERGIDLGQCCGATEFYFCLFCASVFANLNIWFSVIYSAWLSIILLICDQDNFIWLTYSRWGFVE